MKVKLINSSQNLLDNIYLASNTCYSAISPIDRLENINNVDYNKKVNLVSDCIKSGHESVLEHSLFTFAIEGVSRAFLAQISRQRLLSLSVKSQRYVQIKEDKKYLQDVLDRSENAEIMGVAEKYFVIKEPLEARMAIKALISYTSLIEAGYKAEDARDVLPNCTKTDMVLSCNLRELRLVASLRMCSHSQLEIRQVVNEMVKQVVEKEPWLKPYLGPKCETTIGYCNEQRNPCGRKPTLQQILDKK